MTSSAYEVARLGFITLLPEILLILTATAMTTAGAFVKLPRRLWCASAAAAMALALLLLLTTGHQPLDPYGSVVLNDAFAGYGRALFLLSGLVVLALAHDQVEEARAPEFFGALLFINAGSMIVASSNELIFLFVGLELVSIPTYLLLYLPKRSPTTQEAATKYFFLSIFSSGLLLFGLAYLYGLTGVSNLKAQTFLATHVIGTPNGSLGLIALVFVTAGLGFRVAAVPFHFYAPDVYQGSPTVLAAVLSWVPKAVGFMAFLRVITSLIAAAGPDAVIGQRAVLLAWLIAVITMTLGNTVALYQTNLKRLLAYSSIAHAGYLMVGVAVAFQDTDATQGLYFGAEGILFYLTAYALMTLGAFGAIIMLSTSDRTVESVDDLAGLGRTHPLAALGLAVCLFSLAGIPPLAGFWGKFELFAAAFSVTSEANRSLFWWLAVIGVLNSAVGAYYYLKIIVAMCLADPAGEPLRPRAGWPTTLAVLACSGLSLMLGLYPAPILRATRAAAVAAVSVPDPFGDPGPVAVAPATAAE